MIDTPARTRGGRMHIPRSRGAATGLLVFVLGLWGTLAPFVGPLFDFAFSPDRPWAWTMGRGWLQVLPGVVAAVGGLLMLASRNRAAAVLGSWLAVLAGTWFVVGRALASPLGLGDAGEPLAATDAKRAALELAYFSGLGVLIVFLAAVGLGRLSVRTARDLAYTDARARAIDEPRPALGDDSDTVTEVQRVQPADPSTNPRRWRPSLLGRSRRRSGVKSPV